MDTPTTDEEKAAREALAAYTLHMSSLPLSARDHLRTALRLLDESRAAIARVEGERDEARCERNTDLWADAEIRRTYAAEFGISDPNDSPPCWEDFRAELVRLRAHADAMERERDEAKNETAADNAELQAIYHAIFYGTMPPEGEHPAAAEAAGMFKDLDEARDALARLREDLADAHAALQQRNDECIGLLTVSGDQADELARLREENGRVKGALSRVAAQAKSLVPGASQFGSAGASVLATWVGEHVDKELSALSTPDAHTESE